MPEAQIRQTFLALASNTGTTMDTTISMVAAVSGTKIIYDHWEDGYEISLDSPTQASTQVWGDGNDANGKPPGFATDPAGLNSGTVVALRNSIALPRNPASFLYDGRDRLGATRGIVLSRSSWATTPGAVLADATEVNATIDWGTNFVIPVGENEIFPAPLTASMFELCSLFIQASQSGTQVQVDRDANGTVDTTVNLNQGETYYLERGLLRGATVTASKPVQVDIITGDIGGNYECRWYTVAPTSQWGTRYYSPVGTASDGDDTYVFLYNPDSAAITVNTATRVGTGSISIPAKSNHIYLMPQDSGASFINTAGKPFYAIATVGAEPTANNVHDWGFSLIQEGDLTTSLSLGWGPGSSEITPTVNGNPVWVTAVKNTTVYVDYNGDRVGSLTDPSGAKYDVSYSAAALQVLRLFDPDKDQTGMRVYTLDGTLIAGAWGQDPATAGPGNPYLDAGTTIPSFPVPVTRKVSAIAVDANAAGLSVGDTLEYSITMDNAGLVALGNLLVVDALPAQVTYVPNSTTRDSVAVADNVSPATVFPLDASGFNIPILPRGQTTTFKYRAVINSPGSISNTVSTSYAGVTSTNQVSVPGGGTAATISFSIAAGTSTTSYNAGDGVYVTVTDPDANTSATTVQSISVVVKNATTGDYETIVLVETGVNTGIFRNSTAALASSSTAGLGPNDGTLNVFSGNSLTLSYTDPIFGEIASASATINAPVPSKILYLSTDGSGSPDQDLDRIDPVATADVTTANTATVATSTATVAAAASTTATALGPVSSVTHSHTTGTGANRLMLVAVNYEDDGTTGIAINSVTYGGVALTLVSSRNSDQEVCTQIWRLVNPASGTANVVVNGTGIASGDAVHVGATTFTGVNQTTPLGTAANAIGTGTAASVTATSAAGELVFATLALDDSRTATSAAGQTDLWNGLAGTLSTDGVRSVASTKAGAASVVSSWTTGSDAWAALAVSIKPALAPTTLSFTQIPVLAENLVLPAGSVVGAQVHYSVVTGTMPASPAITATLRQGSTSFATSTGVSAGGGLLTFTFPALSGTVNIPTGQAISVDITSAVTGVSFQITYDSTSAPSRIILPTSTVIHVDSVGVYDAPYPNGTLVTSPSNGQVLYVRTVVGDPFGAYDITSLPLSIDGPGTAGDLSPVLTNANVVASSASSKTYEYEWRTGSTTGAYSIVATAKEGFENTISAQRSVAVNLSFQDLGTPSVVEFINSGGTSVLTYAANQSVVLRVTDLDQNTDPAVVETVTVTVVSSSGDTETITLTETGVNTGVFIGTLPASATTVGAGNNGTLHAPTGSSLSVTYIDPTDASDTTTDTATVPAPTAVDGVSISKVLISPAASQVVVGETLQYRLRVVNTGGTALSTVSVTDTFPSSNLTYVGASVTPTTISGGSLTWSNVGSLAQGQAAEIFVTFAAAGAGGTVTNSAAVTAGTASSNSSANVTITRPRVTVSKTLVSPVSGTAGKGDNAVFSIAVQNSGTTAIPSLPLEDIFSNETFDYVSSTLAPDAVGSGSLLWNDITGSGSLAVGATQTISVTLRVKGQANPATNLAAVNYAVDVNGAAVPPGSGTATLVTSAASISGLVQEDRGVAGTGGDIPLAGVTVTLFSDPNNDGNPSDGTVLAVKTTLADGSYEFPNLALGGYVVVESNPPGYSDVQDSEGANDNRIKVTLTTFAASTGWNFLDKYIDPALYSNITGQVRNDTDADGDLTDAEAGIGGVTVDLYTDPNKDGNPSDGTLYATAVTPANGNYSFNLVPPGSYVVIETDLAGYASTRDKTLPNDNQVPVTVAASQTSGGNDLLDTNNLGLLGTVGNAVWSDVDNNGIFDSGEAGIVNVIVQLYKTTQVPGAEAPFRTTTTGLGGIYSFANISTGGYVVYLPAANFAAGGALNAAPLSSAFESAADNRDHGIANGTDATIRSGTIAVAAGVTNNTIDFGFVPNSSLGTISGTVLDDTNNDNAGDFGIVGVTISLYSDPNRDGDTADGVLIGTGTTASNGSYGFTGLPPGGYVVIESQPAGYLNASDTDGGANLSRVILVLAPGATGTASFVEERPGTVNGHLYIDTNGNGVQDGVEPNLADVDVVITDSEGGSTRVTSAANGNWSASVPPGSVSAKVDTADLQFPADHVSTEGTDPTVVVVTAGGTVSAGNDGYYRSATVFGRVYRDVIGNGTEDGGDAGIAGVIVRITDMLGVVRNVPTDSSGSWTVVIPPGAATVDVLELDATFPTGGVHLEGSDPNGVTAVAGAGTNGGTDGYYFPATATGHLYLDVNGNGTQDGGEPPLANIDVIITTSRGTTLVLPTDASGNWTASVPPGPTSADVDENDPQFPTNPAHTEGTDPTSFTAVATQVTLGGIDGYFIPALVQGHLYLDYNGNGAEDPGEPALVGVALKITDSLGNVQNVTTNASGNWQASVPPGATIADIMDTDPIIPAGAVRTEGNDPTTITALAGVTANGGKDGFYQAAGVTGHLYVDANGDGVQNGAEAGLPNVNIIVKDSTGVTLTVVTDANGDWSVSVPPGQTLVDVDQGDPDFPAGGTLSQGTDPVTVTATAGGSVQAGPIGYQILGVVAGHLYIDVNNNQTQDGIEPDISGVDVVVTDSLGNTRRVTTDSSGNWTASVSPGLTTANVDETDPQFPTGSVRSEGTDPTTVTAVAGTNVDGGIDGYYISTSVTGTIYVDVNHNNVRDSGEPGLADVNVTVTDSNNVVQTVLTDGDGVWVASVAPGLTTTAVVESGAAFPSGFVLTQGTGTSSITSLANIPNSVPITGYYFPGIVSGELFSDTNGNGVKDSGEPSLQNISITITDSLGSITTVTTGADGKWTATVPPGGTTADIDDTDTDLPTGSIRTTGTDPTTLTVVSGENNAVGGPVGFYQAATVVGRLYRDVNGNGSRDPGEPALPNVNVFVAGSNGMTQTVVTDINGDWTASVPPGPAVIDIDESDPQYPAGATQTEGAASVTVPAVAGAIADGGASGFFIPAIITGHLYLDLNGNGQQDFVVHNLANVDILITDSNGATKVVVTNENGDWTATVPPGPATATLVSTDPEYPAGSEITQGAATTGFTAVAGSSTGSTPVGFFFPAFVTGHFYVDTNGNGVQDALEPDLADVDVLVRSAINNTQVVTTNSGGNWSAKVPPGNTVIDVDNTDAQYPNGYQQTQGTDPSSVLAVANLTTFSENDGFYQAGSISGHLFTDVNGNGSEDSGEPGLAGVDIRITDSSGNVQTVTTDSSGNWVASVPPGGTLVDIDDNDPQIPTGAVRTAGADPVTVIAIAGVDTPAGGGAGYFLPSTVTGRLYADTNGNFTQQDGEPGLGDIDVLVTDSLGAVTTVVTDIDGNWTASVPPGAVQATVDLADPDFPVGVVQTEGTDPTSAVATAGVTISAGNDGYYLAATVTGLVYRDVNGDGIKDAAEPGLVGVKVRVTDSNGVTRDVLSDGSGVWSASVPPGSTSAEVLELDASFPDGGLRTEGTNPSSVAAAAGTTVDAGNDGYHFPATLTGRVVMDANGNNLVDAGEAGVGNLEIRITDSNLAVRMVTTDASGFWTATVPPGEAQVTVVTSDPDYPAGATQTIGENPTTVVAIATQTVSAGVDGYFIPATVSGLVYLDSNGNGSLQGTEAGIGGVSVSITDSLGNTQIVTTNGSGAWTAIVPPGQTTVTISNGPPVPSGAVVTQGAASATLTAVAGTTGDIGRTGFYQAGTLSGHLYNDVDGSGTENGGDTGLVGVDVRITDSLGVIRVVTTDLNGNWSVSLPPGDAAVDVDQSDPDFPAGGTLSQGTDPTNVTAIAGTNVPAGTLGYRILGIVFGHLYVDVNQSGAQDPGEPNLAGITVTVTDSAAVPHVVETDADGNWTANIPPGLAVVDVDQLDAGFPAGAAQSEGTDPSNVNAIAGLSVDAGNDGYYISTLVTGTIYIDLNNNGQREAGEPGLPGVSVEVTDITTLVRTVTTDSDGNWAASVAAGAVTTHVMETGPIFTAGYLRTEGTGNGSTTAVGGTPASVAITGYYFPGTVSGHLYADRNGNGEQDSGEENLADIEVSITDSNGNTTVINTNTTGDWSISLPPGPANIVIAPNETGLPVGSILSEGTDPTMVTVVSGQTVDGGTDGFYLPATVTGHLYVDTNGNGLQDEGEPDVAGVSVTVVGSGGTVVNVVTDPNGSWIASVPPGNTVIDIDETDPDYPAGSVQTQGQALTAVNAVAGDTVSGGTNGYFVPAIFKGHLYLDLNGNGQQDFVFHNLSNVDIIVVDSTGTTRRVTTDASGDWTVSLPPGPATATVDAGDPEYPAGSVITQGAATTSFTAVAGSTDNTTPVGFFFPAVVTGHLYVDTNGNGRQDAGEPDLPDVSMVVTSAINNPQTVTTDSQGNWVATVPPGNTTVNINAPPGYEQTEGDDPSVVLAVASLSTFSENDGFYLPGMVKGHVYADVNGNNIQDGLETGIAGVSVAVTDSNAVVQTVTTDSNGDWKAEVPPGDTIVDVVESAPQVPAGSIRTEGADPQTVVAQAGVEVDAGNDGYFTPGTISGLVRSDTTNDGTPDLPVPGVIISLFDGGNVPIASTTTAAEGSYSFTGLKPGSYSVRETQPIGYLSVSDTDGGNPDIIGEPTPIQVTSGIIASDQNFTERPLKEPNGFIAWQAIHPLGGANNPGDNPDGDLYGNLIEYAFATAPDSGAGNPFCLVASLSDPGAVDGVYTRTAGGALDVLYQLEGIADLALSPGGWSPVALSPSDQVVTDNGDGTETVRILNLRNVIGLAGAGFVRMRVLLDVDGDATYEAEAATETGGWVKSDWGTECRTYNNPFVSCPVFSGIVDGVNGQQLDLQTSAAGSNLASVLLPGAYYYLEVVSGDLAGHRFDITGTGTAAMTLANDGLLFAPTAPFNTMTGALPATLAGDHFVVRVHTTLGQMFPIGAFTAGAGQDTADQVQTYANGAFITYWLYQNGGSPKWARVGDGSLSDQGNIVIPPGQGTFINCLGAPGSLLAFGKIRQNDFIQPLMPGNNLVRGGYPMAESPLSRAMTIPGGFDGDRDPKKADQIFIWRGDALTGQSGYDTYFLLDGAPVQPALQRWAKVGDASAQARDSAELFKRDNSAFIKLNGAIPAHRTSLPWQP